MLRLSRLPFLGLVLLLPLCVAAPAGAQADPAEGPLLKKDTLSRLNRLLLGWYKIDSEANEMQNQVTLKVDSKGRSLRKGKINALKKKAAKKRTAARKARRKFQDQFKTAGKSVGGDLLKSIPDLLEIFEGCFPYKKMSNTGVTKTLWVNKKKKQGYALRTPKPYSEKRPWPMIWALPSRAGKEWSKPLEFLEKGLPATNEQLLQGYLVGTPTFPDDMELSGKFDPTKNEDTSIALVGERITWLWKTLKNVFDQYHVDTDRVYLSATAESIPFALRVASMFPDRFAGLILQNPLRSDFDPATVFGNLTGIAVFLAADGTNEEHAKKIRDGLKAAGHQAVTLVRAKGTAPFTDVLPNLVEWLDKTKRNLYPRKFVLTPAHDKFRKAYWVTILEGDYLHEVPIADRPRIEVSADPVANKIEVKGRGVRSVRLYFNDVLVNLDKQITLVLNGKVLEVKRRRNLSLVTNTRSGLVFARNDPKFLFVTSYDCDLPAPKTDGKGSDAASSSGGKAGGGKSGGNGNGR